MTHRSIPPLVLQKAEAMGAEGLAWLDELDDTIGALERQWQVRIGEAMAGGTHSYVAQAELPGGETCILKLALPDYMGTAFAPQASALAAANGQGYVQLLRCDPGRHACLLEQLGRPLGSLGYSPLEQMKRICETLQTSWIPAQSPGLQTGQEIIAFFRESVRSLWEELGRPCPARVVDVAYAFLDMRELDYHPEEFVLVHGDAHGGNVLEAPGGGFKLVDPDGIYYEKAYDLGVLMREWTAEYSGNPVESGLARCAYLHQLTGADRQAIWAWGFIQCVSTGLLCLKVGGLMEIGQMMLDAAEAWMEVRP